MICPEVPVTSVTGNGGDEAIPSRPPKRGLRGDDTGGVGKGKANEAKPGARDAGAVTADVTRTGSKYRAEGCRHLSRSRIPMALKDPRGRYGPCSVCNLPR
jgi:hypothetical protein